MLSSEQWWLSFSESPFLLFIILLFFAHAFYYRYFRYTPPNLGSGSIVMAFAEMIFTYFYFFYNTNLLMIFALLLLILWCYLSIGVIHAYMHDKHLFADKYDQLQIGTWVVATLLTTLVLDKAEETLHGVIVLLGLISFYLYLFYLLVSMRWMLRQAKPTLYPFFKGEILLFALSTQALVILLMELFRDDMVTLVYQIIIGLGVIFYFVAFVLLAKQFFAARLRHPKVNVLNIHSLNYGAMSIAGLTMLLSNSFANDLILSIWWWSVITFLILETIELIRFVIKIKCTGWRKSILAYRQTQWIRIFAFGMLYVFTLSCYTQGLMIQNWMKLPLQIGPSIFAILLVCQVFRAMVCANRKEKAV